jgi:hypothetical protein
MAHFHSNILGFDTQLPSIAEAQAEAFLASF